MQNDQPIKVNTVQGNRLRKYYPIFGTDLLDAVRVDPTPYVVTEVGSYLSQDWEIKPNDSTIRVNLTDGLTKLQSKQLDDLSLKEFERLYDAGENGTLTARGIIKKLLQLGGLLSLDPNNPNLVFDTVRIDDIRTEDIYLDKGSLFEQLQKVLNYAKCRLYCEGEKIIVKSV